MDLRPNDWCASLRVRPSPDGGHAIVDGSIGPRDLDWFYSDPALSDDETDFFHSWAVRIVAELGDGVTRERWSGSDSSVSEETFRDDTPWCEDLWLPARARGSLTVEMTLEIERDGETTLLALAGSCALADDRTIELALHPHDCAGGPFAPPPVIAEDTLTVDERRWLPSRAVSWRWTPPGPPPPGLPERAWGWSTNARAGRLAWRHAFAVPRDHEQCSIVYWHDANGALGQVLLADRIVDEVVVTDEGTILALVYGGRVCRIEPDRGSAVTDLGAP